MVEEFPSPTSDPEAYFRHLADEAATESQEVRAAQRRGTGLGPPWVIISLIGVAALLAVAVGTLLRTRTDDTGPESTIVARAPVGPEGATIPFGEGARLVVPSGALGTTRVITIRRFPEETSASDDAILDVAESRYAFEPTDVRFRVPVRVVFPVPSGSEATVQLTTDGTTRELPATVDARAGTAEVRTVDFSSWTSAAEAGGLTSMDSDVR